MKFLGFEIKRTEANTGKGTLNKGGFSMIRSPAVNHNLMLDVWNKDENAALAIQGIGEAVVGVGHEIVLEGKDIAENTRDKVTNLLREFNEDNDVDNFLFDTIQEVAGFGVSFTEKIDSSKLETIARLPIDDSWTIDQPKKTGRVDFEQVTQMSSNAKFTPDNMILWRFNRHSVSDAYGRGILHYLTEPKTYTIKINDVDKTFTIPALYITLWMLQNDIRLAAHHLAPRSVWLFKGADDAWVEANAKEINSLGPGERFTANFEDVKILSETIDTRMRLDTITNFYESMIIKATQNPISALYTKEGYSLAATEGIMKQFNRKIIMLRKYAARKLEREVYSKLMRQEGFDPRLIRPRVNWLSEVIPVSQLQDYMLMFRDKAITQQELRKILKTLFKIPLSEEQPEEKP